MGRGKKKDKKSDKPEEPSTSQPEASEESGGLTGGKKDTAPMVKPSSTSQSEASEEGGGLTGGKKTSVGKPVESKSTQGAEDESGGLTGGGKSRSRKKPAKKDAAAVRPAPSDIAPVAEPSVVGPPPVAQPPVPSWGQKTTGPLEGGGGRGDLPLKQHVPPSAHPVYSTPGPAGDRQYSTDVGAALQTSVEELSIAGSRATKGPPPGWDQKTTGPPGRGRGRGGAQFQQHVKPVGSAPGPSGGYPVEMPSMRPGPPPGVQHYAAPGPSSASSTPIPTSQAAPTKSDTTIALKKTMSGLRIPLKVWPTKDRNYAVPYKNISVLTNYLQMTLTAKKIYRYDVLFKPDRPKKFLPIAYANMVAAHKLPLDLAFDQVKNCYSLVPLPNVPKDGRFSTNVEVVDSNKRIIKFEVSLKLTGIVDTQTILDYMKNKASSLNPPTEAISCVDVVLRQGTLQKYVKVGRQFFRRPGNPIDLTGGLEMWTGLFQSAIFTSSAFINIDLAHKGFPKEQPLVQALTNDFRLATNQTVERQRGRGVEQFQDFIRNLRVIAVIGGDSTTKGQKREFMCNGLVDSPLNIKFASTDANGKTKSMTVADYFREKGVRLNYPHLNCVWVGPRDKTIYYPMELLTVAYGQRSNKTLNEMQLSTMVKTAAAPPHERKKKIDEVKQAMDYSKNTYFKKFGLNISNEFFEVGARILKPPTLDVGSRQTTMPRDGVWNATGLLKPEALKSWGFIALECDQRNAIDHDGMIRMIQSTGRQMGMEVNDPFPCLPTASMKELSSILFKCLDKGVKFLFIIVGTWMRDIYQKVKQMAELDVGILTQCIKENTATRRMNFQTVKNILLKVNSKLMGINQALNSASKPQCLRGGGVMVVGADVTHPSPDQPNVPSIAAVTASMDPDCYKYNIELSVQTPKREMIMDFEEMMLDHLKIYKQKMQYLPTKIFYFRDGVSEGQFAEVMDSELLAMHRAYQRLSGGPKPEILFLLVQKRHHTRFFLGNARDIKNVEPGTVVDEHIVHASELDFYLVSHKAIKGTARPTRYHAVCNDGNIPYDEVEQLTYYLCHLYSRCMRAVSYPTPTYYAHLACLRAKTLTYGKQFNNQDLERTPVRLRVLDKMLQFSRMFFV